jgi:hypothetical protein
MSPNIKHAKLANISLEDLQEKADIINKEAKDYNINLEKHKISFTDNIQMKAGTHKFDITEHALGQLCTTLGIPSSYMKKCIEEEKVDLFKRNIATWAKDLKGDICIRTNRGVARAIVSKKYVPYDNDEVLRDITSAISDTGMELVPVGAYLNEDRLNLRLIDINKPFYIKGDQSPMYFGISVSNSNIGTSSTSIKFFIYRQWCKNGCTISAGGGELYKQSHAGTQHKFMRRLKFQAAIQNMDLLRDNVELFLQESQGKILKIHEMEEMIEKMKKECPVSEKAAKSILEVAEQKYGSTKYGFINGITEVAQEYDLDTRLQFESYAGKLIMSR